MLLHLTSLHFYSPHTHTTLTGNPVVGNYARWKFSSSPAAEIVVVDIFAFAIVVVVAVVIVSGGMQQVI